MNDRYRILLVDDSDRDRGIYRRYLLANKDYDYQILEAETLKEGLELWRSRSPDLVLVDLDLPDGSGLELLEAIQKTQSRKKIPVIMMTGQGHERIAVQAMKLGASDYLLKDDITASTLCHYVRSAIAQGNLAEKLTQLEEQENFKLKERLQFILASSSAIIYSCKPYEPYEATFMSENIEAILGYSAEEFTTQDNFWANHLHPEDAPRVFSKLSALFEVGTHTHEYRFLHKKGYYIWLRDQLCLVRDEQGNPLEIIGSCFDISDRKQAEAEGKEFNRRWRSVLDKIQMIVIELDLDGNVQYINPFFLKISGFAPEEVINKHWITHFVSSEHQLSLETVFQEILEEINNEYYVNPILTKSGEERIISWHNSVLK
ncbi:MAG: PAS domain-containing protein, partial [Snowella sp.]